MFQQMPSKPICAFNKFTKKKNGTRFESLLNTKAPQVKLLFAIGFVGLHVVAFEI